MWLQTIEYLYNNAIDSYYSSNLIIIYINIYLY